MNQIIQGDALTELKKLSKDSIDLVCTDPPYGYSFMGKDWDKAVPSVDMWQECLRVLKPGAFACVMSAPRSDVQMHMIQNLTEAGFRLDFTPIYWTYASGFPKAGNIGKMVDKRNGNERQVLGVKYTGKDFSDETLVAQGSMMQSQRTEARKDVLDTRGSSELEGSYAGFQPKPAVEVIIVAMKPLSEKTFVDQALKNGKGITWLDDCRIPTEGEVKTSNGDGFGGSEIYGSGINNNKGGIKNGRFPANLLVSDDVLNDGVKRKTGNIKPYERKSTGQTVKYNNDSITGTHIGDSGSYSRYFDLDKWATTLPFLIVPKASKSEKNKGLDNFVEKDKPTLNEYTNPSEGRTAPKNGSPQKNHHPTVKPLKLISYLITLGSREGDTVLDPFVGSGTTCLAAKNLNRKYIGIEREAEYVEIAESRLAQQPLL